MAALAGDWIDYKGRSFMIYLQQVKQKSTWILLVWLWRSVLRRHTVLTNYKKQHM